MFKYIVKRILSSILVLLGVVTITFFISRVLPSNPEVKWAGQRATPEQLAAARIELGLDKTLPEQYVIYLNDLLHGNLGKSLNNHQPVTSELKRYIPATLELVLLAFALAIAIGIPLGAIAGSFGGWVDNLIMRITDVFLSFPPLLLAIAMVAVMGSSLNNAILAIALSWWPWYTRLIRGQAISVKERKFVQAAETIGTGRMKIIFKHIIPNCISPVIVQASMDIGGVILTVASLSFLGLGAQLPTPEWGLMISMGRRFFPDSWWYCIFPGLAIFVTVLCFNLLGDAIREILDPKTRKN